MVIVVFHRSPSHTNQPNACMSFYPPDDPYRARIDKQLWDHSPSTLHKCIKTATNIARMRSFDVALLMMHSCWWKRGNPPVTQWMCKILWDNTHSQLLLPYGVHVWSRDIFANITCHPRIHSPCNYERACWPPSHRQTDALNLWQNYMNSEHYFFFIFPLWCSALDRVLLVRWKGGWAVSTFMRVSACVGVSVGRCVSDCRQWRLQDVNTWGYSQLGWMNYSRLSRCKRLVYLSAHRCARPGTLTQISSCSHTVESVWEVRETYEVANQHSGMKMSAVNIPHSAPRQDFMLAVGEGSYHWLISESLHCDTDSICWSEFNAAWISAVWITSFHNLDAIWLFIELWEWVGLW